MTPTNHTPLAVLQPTQLYISREKLARARLSVALEEFPDLWDEANPCLYMIRDLGWD